MRYLIGAIDIDKDVEKIRRMVKAATGGGGAILPRPCLPKSITLSHNLVLCQLYLTPKVVVS